jgi:hypothetical protein
MREGGEGGKKHLKRSRDGEELLGVGTRVLLRGIAVVLDDKVLRVDKVEGSNLCRIARKRRREEKLLALVDRPVRRSALPAKLSLAASRRGRLMSGLARPGENDLKPVVETLIE